MTRHFCDICGQAAILGDPSLEVALEACQIRLRAVFYTADRQAAHGHGGPPDLCADCRRKLVGELLARATPAGNGRKHRAFSEAWQSSGTAVEAAAKLRIPVTTARVYAWRYRKRGLRLKRMNEPRARGYAIN